MKCWTRGPGLTKTGLNGNTGFQTVEQGGQVTARMALVRAGARPAATRGAVPGGAGQACV
ncbi:hypothetical protein [Actinacidiphila sp. bgisy160]|uniref:hypothetical protein n=1 Tax=Actinacidiphila sp. bgisy160 TaxID=3413796 RepID=UPI003D718588